MTVKDKRRVIELETELNRTRQYLAAVTFMLSPTKPSLRYRPPGFADNIETVLNQADAILGDAAIDRNAGTVSL